MVAGVKSRTSRVAQDFALQDLKNVKLQTLGSDPSLTEGQLIYKANALKVGGSAEWIQLADNADLQNHINDNENPHVVTLEQARYANNTLSGNIDADGHTIVGLADPTNSGDAASRGWTLAQIDVAKNSFDVKQEVIAAITSNVDISTALVNGANLGGVTLATGDRVALVGQTNASQNGIYVVVVSGAASRSVDMASSDQVTTGLFFLVIAGTKAGAQYVLTTQGAITLGTTNLTFSQYFGGASYSAGDGLALSGSTFSVNATAIAGAGLENDGSNNLRIAASAAGEGLQGGGGSALSVKIDVTGDANIATALIAGQNGVGLLIDNSTLGQNESSYLIVKDAGITKNQLSTNVAGAGLLGGEGTALYVNVDNATLEISSNLVKIKNSVFGSGLTLSSNVASVNWASQKYNMSFNATTDWGSVNGDGQYVITVAAGTHALGTEPVVVGVVGIDGSSNKYGTELYHEVNTSGDVLIYVTGASARFAGKLYLVKA
jgi:hypothetical protein